MTTLHSKPFSEVLSRLETEANTSETELRQRLADMAPTARAAMMKLAKEDPTNFYVQTAKDMFLAVAPETRRLLYMLARSNHAKSIVEFGTSFGVSTLFLAAAVRDNGGGKIITAEFESGKAKRARATFDEAGVSDLIELREGDALTTLANALPDSIDLVLLDGAKSLYSRVLELLEPKLKSGALVLADNADDSPEYVAKVRRSDRYLSIPIGEELELSLKI